MNRNNSTKLRPITPNSLLGARFSRGQAAIFDGIMFLLFASVSVALIFVFLNGYGISQDTAMRSAYIQAYLQDAAKSLFYMDVRTLSKVALEQEVDVLWKDPNAGLGTAPCTSSNGDGCPYWDLKYGSDITDHCAQLSQYFATTVADLVKRDLGDSDVESSVSIGGVTGIDTSVLVCLDNHFGLKQGSSTTCDSDYGNVPTAHGKTALRCALKEMLKPLQQAGYYYFVEIVNRVPAEHAIPLKTGTPRITNYWLANEDQWSSCNDAVTRGYTQNGQTLSFQVLTVSMPFRVPRANRLDQMRDFILKICVWPGRT